jgi:hypothetical protein
MRFYNIVITNSSGAVLRQYTSLASDGTFNPQCLRVTLDIPQSNFAQPAGLAMVRIYGVAFTDINSTADINGMNVTISAGMSKGLPLANPKQQGVIARGYVYQAFGNWQGTEISLDLIIAPSVGNADQAAAITLDWKQGTPLTGAVTNALNAAFPSIPVVGQFSDAVTANQDTPHISSSMGDFAQKVNEFSNAVATQDDYLGANIAMQGDKFYLFDGTSTEDQTTVAIAFTDLIGNATWIEYNVMQFKAVMRGDLSPGGIVTLPKGTNAINSQNTFTQFRQNLSFQNSFMVSKIRHLGDSRQRGADSWVTVVDCNLLNTQNISEAPLQ